jgi:hypothetical protein
MLHAGDAVPALMYILDFVNEHSALSLSTPWAYVIRKHSTHWAARVAQPPSVHIRQWCAADIYPSRIASINCFSVSITSLPAQSSRFDTESRAFTG